MTADEELLAERFGRRAVAERYGEIDDTAREQAAPPPLPPPGPPRSAREREREQRRRDLDAALRPTADPDEDT